MAKKINFVKGEFITHINNPKAFAIYEGEPLTPSVEDKDKVFYSLLCYYNPHQCSKNQYHSWTITNVFDYTMDDKQCQYSLSDADIAWWRRMNQKEVEKAISILANKHLAFDPISCSLRHMYPGEKLVTPTQTQFGIHNTGKSVALGKSSIKLRNGRTVTRTASYDDTVKVKLTTPDDYTQTKKIKGLTNRMMKSLRKAIKIENKKGVAVSSTVGSNFHCIRFGCYGDDDLGDYLDYGGYYDDDDFYNGMYNNKFNRRL